MDALGINLPGLLTQLVSFLILFGFLYAVLYKPIFRILDQRSAKIKESLAMAEDARLEAARSQKDIEKQISEARAEGQAMMVQAREVAERFREEELAKARGEIASQRSRAENEVRRERDLAIEDLRRKFADLAIIAAEQITRRSLDKAAHKELVDGFLDQAPRLGNDGN